MPNARDANRTVQHRILCLGDTGSGKTSQILTLPGKKFAYLFDGNALLSLRGYDVDYDEYLPEVVTAAVSSLSKSKPGDKRGTVSSDVYQVFEAEFDKRLQTGFFDDYDWICMDSSTTLLDLIMDRVMSINGMFGQWPTQDSYGPQMIAFTNICRTLTGLGKGIYMTGHLETKQDQLTMKVTNRPMMTGRLVAKIPLLFSDVFYCDSNLDDKGKVNYRIQTVPSGQNRNIRCSIKGLDTYEDVTIDFSKDPVGQGLGGILQWEQQQAGV